MSKFVTLDQNVLSGSPVFRGTRVLVKSLFDYVENGESIEDFLFDFPTVSRSHAIGFLEELRQDSKTH